MQNKGIKVAAQSTQKHLETPLPGAWLDARLLS